MHNMTTFLNAIQFSSVIILWSVVDDEFHNKNKYLIILRI